MHGYRFDTIITGAYCEHGNIVARSHADDVCVHEPCLNSGTCVSKGSSYECICSAGFIGRNCEMTTKCSADFCQHGGSCRDYVS